MCSARRTSDRRRYSNVTSSIQRSPSPLFFLSRSVGFMALSSGLGALDLGIRVGTPNPLGSSVTSFQSDWQTAYSQIVDLFSELSTFVLLYGHRGSHFVSRVFVERGTGVENSCFEAREVKK